MKIISREFTFAFTGDEVEALEENLGNESTNDRLAKGLSEEQDKLIFDIYEKLKEAMGGK